MRACVVLLGILAVSSPLQAGEFDAIPFEQVFPEADQSRMGLSKLTPAERENLKAFVLERLLQAFVRGQGEVTPDAPESQKPVAPRSQGSMLARVYSSVGRGHWIDKNIDGGSLIKLEDGSLWEIDAYDKYNTILWLAISDITVLESSDCVNGYLLVNTDDGEKACAKYLGSK